MLSDAFILHKAQGLDQLQAGKLFPDELRFPSLGSCSAREAGKLRDLQARLPPLLSWVSCSCGSADHL